MAVKLENTLGCLCQYLFDHMDDDSMHTGLAEKYWPKTEASSLTFRSTVVCRQYKKNLICIIQAVDSVKYNEDWRRSDEYKERLKKFCRRPSVSEIVCLLDGNGFSKNKLQDILFLEQACHLAHFGTPLFAENFEMRSGHPTLPLISEGKPFTLTEKEREPFELVLAEYGKSGNRKLRETVFWLCPETLEGYDVDNNALMEISFSCITEWEPIKYEM